MPPLGLNRVGVKKTHWYFGGTEVESEKGGEMKLASVLCLVSRSHTPIDMELLPSILEIRHYGYRRVHTRNVELHRPYPKKR